jgi:CBS domain-containing protein
MIPTHLTVGDLMTTAVISLQEGATIRRADADMRLAEIRHLPVVDSGGHVVGVVSDRDLLRALSRRGTAVAVAKVMTRHVRTVSPGTPARRAAEIMLAQKIGCLPVVGDEQELVGIVTETDFLRLAVQLLGGDQADVEAMR